MAKCTHSIEKQVEARIDGLCPLCLQAEVEWLKVEVGKLSNQKKYIYKKEVANLETKIVQLKSVFDHPNHDNPKRRYLYEIKNAIKLLKAFAKIKGGGEYAYGVAQQLKQFIKRVEPALKEGG